MNFESFWKKHPALLYGLGMLLGIALVFQPYAWALYFTLILLLVAAQKRLVLLILWIGFSMAYTSLQIHLPQITTPITNTALFKIASLSESSTHFGKQYLYKGTLTSLPEFKNLPITISVPVKKEITRPSADRDYFIEGTLSQKGNGRYLFKLDKLQPWIPIEKSWSLAEMRYRMKI